MNILETRISTFASTRETETLKGQIDTVGLYLERIRNGTYKKLVQQVRAGNEEVKKELPTVAFHGLFETFRKAKDFYEASGLVILDIDDVDNDEIGEIKQDIMDSSENVLAVMTSPSGDGIKVLYYVQPDLVTADNYRQIGKQLVTLFDVYGKVDYLSVTDCLIMTWDPDILINENVEPAFVYVKQSELIKYNLEAIDKNRTLWTDVEDFFETVLVEDIESKTNSNFHYIQVAILDLAKFGFYHPKEDLSFVVDYAENAFGSSPRNRQRFNEVTAVASDYPQTQWPYKVIGRDGDDEEEDDGFTDYSEYIKPKVTRETDTRVEGDKSESNEDKEIDYFIDYGDFFSRIKAIIAEGDRVGFEISLKSFANIFRLKGTGILTITGIPGHGKTEFVDQILVDLGRLYGHHSLVVGFEQTPEEHAVKIMRRITGTNVTCPSYTNEKQLEESYNFVRDTFTHINTNKTGGNISIILEEAAKKVKELRDAGKDPRYMVLDPFNMLSIKGRFSGHEKIEEILRRITHFSHQMGILVILVAHPFKMKKDEVTGTYEVPDFYSVKGSSAFFEMSYHGLVVYRTGYGVDSPVLVRVLKIKQSNLGETGEEVNFKYHRNSGRYIPIDSDCNEESGDHYAKDWLEKYSVIKEQLNKK